MEKNSTNGASRGKTRVFAGFVRRSTASDAGAGAKTDAKTDRKAGRGAGGRGGAGGQRERACGRGRIEIAPWAAGGHLVRPQRARGPDPRGPVPNVPHRLGVDAVPPANLRTGAREHTHARDERTGGGKSAVPPPSTPQGVARARATRSRNGRPPLRCIAH